MRDPRANPGSAHLDALRAVSALVVFAGHVRQYLFVQWTPAFRGNLPARIIYFTTGFGHEAVMVFFVLSGYLVGGAVLRAHAAGAWSWPRYLLARLTRLWLVLLPALVLGAIIDAITLSVFGARLQAREVIAERFTPLAWLGNLFFLQGVLAPEFGSNTPLWSLSYELWYYLAFPFAVGAVLSRSWRARALNTLAVLAILVFTRKAVAPYFVVWLFGAAVWMLPALPARWSRPVTAAGLLALAPLLVVLGTRPGYRASFAADLAVGVLVAVVVAGLHAADQRPSALYVRVTRFWASWSYSLYLVHFPPVLLVSVALFTSFHERWLPTARNGALGALIAAAVLCYAYLISRLTEARTEAVRAWLLRRLGLQR
jgi:peptidoglycan/LPS O-acetylase OafA/YrhL